MIIRYKNSRLKGTWKQEIVLQKLSLNEITSDMLQNRSNYTISQYCLDNEWNSEVIQTNQLNQLSICWSNNTKRFI